VNLLLAGSAYGVLPASETEVLPLGSDSLTKVVLAANNQEMLVQAVNDSLVLGRKARGVWVEEEIVALGSTPSNIEFLMLAQVPHVFYSGDFGLAFSSRDLSSWSHVVIDPLAQDSLLAGATCDNQFCLLIQRGGALILVSGSENSWNFELIANLGRNLPFADLAVGPNGELSVVYPSENLRSQETQDQRLGHQR